MATNLHRWWCTQCRATELVDIDDRELAAGVREIIATLHEHPAQLQIRSVPVDRDKYVTLRERRR